MHDCKPVGPSNRLLLSIHLDFQVAGMMQNRSLEMVEALYNVAEVSAVKTDITYAVHI